MLCEYLTSIDKLAWAIGIGGDEHRLAYGKYRINRCAECVWGGDEPDPEAVCSAINERMQDE
jgi:hypothetical protein